MYLPIITMYSVVEHFKKKTASYSNDHLSACGQIKIPRKTKTVVQKTKHK